MCKTFFWKWGTTNEQRQISLPLWSLYSSGRRQRIGWSKQMREQSMWRRALQAKKTF